MESTPSQNTPSRKLNQIHEQRTIQTAIPVPTTADGAEKRVFLMNTLTGRTMVCVAPTIAADPGRGEDGGYETHTTSSSSPMPGGLSRIVMSPPLAGSCKILNLRRHNYSPSRKKQG